MEEFIDYDESSLNELITKIGYFGLKLLPEAVYYWNTSKAKKIRTRIRNRQYKTPANSEKLSALVNSEMKVCLTHDIDSLLCWTELPNLLDIEYAKGIRSTINFLTAGPYKIDLGFLKEIQEMGFEIGLHGDEHDLAMGYRNLNQLDYRFGKSMERLKDFNIVSFRAPGCGMSRRAIPVIKKHGIKIDSSMFGGTFLAQNSTYGPFKDKETGLIELPLILSEDSLYRDRTLDHSSVRQIIETEVAAARYKNQVLTVNLHPRAFSESIKYGQTFLELILSIENTSFYRMRDFLTT
jgi:peptidoglycan/xylan/chitin deacetylase (PgdA/CDA1 family)